MNQALLQLRIQWAAFFAACPLYLYIAHTVIEEGEPVLPMLRWIFLAVSLMQILFVLFVYQPMMQKRLENTEGDNRNGQLFARQIICVAMYESIAIYGFVVGMMNNSFTDALAFTLLAMAMLLQLFPRASLLEE